MVDAASAGGSREQTLLEAAKALMVVMQWSEASQTCDLRAAIAREEAKPASSEQIEGLKIAHAAQRDRAQQAEASAAWHKAESERLSAELAKRSATLSAMTQAVGMLTTLHGSMLIDVGDPIGMARKIVEHVDAGMKRAEKAEADLAGERRYLHQIYVAAGRRLDEPFMETLANLRQRAEKAEAESERLSEDLRTARELLAYSKCAWQERAEKAEAELAKAKSHPMDGGDITVMLNRAGVKAWGNRLPQGMTTLERIEWLIGEWDKLRLRVDLAKEALGGKL